MPTKRDLAGGWNINLGRSKCAKPTNFPKKLLLDRCIGIAETNLTHPIFLSTIPFNIVSILTAPDFWVVFAWKIPSRARTPKLSAAEFSRQGYGYTRAGNPFRRSVKVTANAATESSRTGTARIGRFTIFPNVWDMSAYLRIETCYLWNLTEESHMKCRSWILKTSPI